MSDRLLARLATYRLMLDAGGDELGAEQWDALADIVELVMRCARDKADAQAREEFLRGVIERCASDFGWRLH